MNEEDELRKVETIQRTMKAPEKLAEAMKIVNYLPLLSDLPTIEELFDKEDDRFLYKYFGFYPVEGKLFRTKFQEVFNNYCNKEFENFWKFIWGESNPDLSLEASEKLVKIDWFAFFEETKKAALNYARLFKLNAQFQYLIRLLGQSIMKNKEWLNGAPEHKFEKRTLELIFNQIPISPNFELGKDFNVTVSLDEFSQAINGVHITRIRSCARKKCQRVFYAGRVGENYDTKCCSIKCSKQYFSQQSMSKNKWLKKKERREKVVEQLKKRFVNGKPQWTENATLIIGGNGSELEEIDLLFKDLHPEKITQSEKLNLPKGTEVEILDVYYFEKFSLKTHQGEMPVRFSVRLKSGEEGYVEVEYSNQFSTNLKRNFDLVD